ncbi:MAG: hypothetical protein IKA87_05780, partial [Lentisphaeria bacterium]|nr:hypothetical protein [Lentisphaeria bacterium]
LPPVMLALAGCHSDAWHQERAVDSARQFIYENARELTPEQFAFVKMTPPVLLNGQIFSRSTGSRETLPAREKRQICVSWKIPETNTHYMVFGMSDPGMAYWKPLRLIRREINKSSTAPLAALNKARNYAVSSWVQELSSADLNIIRFSIPEAVQTSFKLDPEKEKKYPAPWGKLTLPDENKGIQISLLWKISGDRYAVFCGIGPEDLGTWNIVMAGIMKKDEVAGATVKKIKTPENFFNAVPAGRIVTNNTPGGK